MAAPLSRVTGSSSRKLALIGSNGMLARKVFEQAASNGYAVTGFDLPDFDLTNRSQVLAEMERVQPAVIVNCAASTNVDGAESDEELATCVNGTGPGYLAEAAKSVGAVLVHFSTDYVFDGNKRSPYLESDPVCPLSAYGRSKLAGEQAILASDLERYFIVRTSWLYGPGGKNFVETIIRLAREREELRVVADQIGSPTYTVDLAEAVFRLLKAARDEESVTKKPLQRGRDGETVMKEPLQRGRDEETVMKEPLQRGRDEETVTGKEPLVTVPSSRVTVPSSLVTVSSSLVTVPSSLVTVPSSRVTVPSSQLYGIYHFSNSGQCSWCEFASEIVAQMKGRGEALKVKKVVPIRTDDYPLPATRPAYSVFSKEKYRQAMGAEIPEWRESLSRYLAERP